MNELVEINEKDYDFLEVVSIKNSKQFTVDIEVEDNHHYILENGVVSHNTISLLPEVSSGIEPLFAKSFIRRDRAGNRVYMHPLYEKLITETHKIPKWFVDAHDLSANEHILVQRIVQKFVDGSVSKTINLQKGTTKEQLSDLLLNNIKYLKGVTVYVDGSRQGQILNRMSDGQVISYLKKNGKLTSNVLTEDDVECNVCSRAKEYKHRDYEDIKKEVLEKILSKK